MNIKIVSDGGMHRKSGASRKNDLPRSACASYIYSDDGKVIQKLVGFLGHSSDEEAELMGGVLGLSYVKALFPQCSKITWLTDRKTLASSAEKVKEQRQVPKSFYWEMFLAVVEHEKTSIEHLSKENKKDYKKLIACDRACTWIIEKGDSLLVENASVFLGRNATLAKEHAWNLLDLRAFMDKSISASECVSKLSTHLIISNENCRKISK